MKCVALLVLWVVGVTTSTLAQHDTDAILGEWLSVKKDTRVLIYRQGTQYFGEVTWGTGSLAKDEKNPDPALRNQEVIGLIILRDFTNEKEST